MSRISSGARNKTRSLQDICADCGATEPGWASINRGILLCDECCSVHRSLGRHMSHIKSLKKGIWHPSQLAMVQTLNISGANNIWEHTLLDPSASKGPRRKPHSKDPVHPNKADFIRAKHQMLSFVYRPNRDENSASEGDISRQLHSSVRTSNLETSLRLLSLGADPNYYHNEKGNCPLHVAAKAGQAAQLELLAIYGADPGALDKDGLSPVDYARDGGYHDLVERLTEFQYELTDSLAFYLCGRKPNHTNGHHWIIPEMSDALDPAEVGKEARQKLVALPNLLFEELVSDVYDEVDRRETDSIWLSLQNQSALLSDRCSVAFLPVNPDYSATRNQGRQKLARFNAREFATLIIDVLIETRRRMVGFSPIGGNDRERDDEPLYDSVASEDDYSSWERKKKIKNQQDILTRQGHLREVLLEDDYQEVVESTECVQKGRGSPVPIPAAVSIEKYLEMKKQLEMSEAKIKHLQTCNDYMKSQLDQFSTTGPRSLDGVPGSPAAKQRPYSMIESSRGSPGVGRSHHTSFNIETSHSSLDKSCNDNMETTPLMGGFPSQEEVVLKTEVITKRIQELLRSAQDSRHEEFIPCSEQINLAVKEMSDLFPKVGSSPELSSAVRQLVASAARLHSECRTHVASQLHTLDPEMVSQQVIQCAYDIAKAAKVLVTHFQ